MTQPILKLKLNKSIKGFKKGKVLSLPAHRDGLPIDRFWRERLKDSELDNCCEVVKTKKKTPSKSKPEKESKE